MATPEQMYTHELNPIKGWWDEHALDKAADTILGADETRINGGMVMSLNAAAKFQKGLACAAVAIFAIQASDSFDVVGDDGNMVGSGGGDPVGGTPIPKMSGLVAFGGYELESTEFDADQLDAYVPNATLSAGLPGAANAGLLVPGQRYVDTVCGVVSDGVVSNEHKIDVLRFWPTWLPPVAACPEESSQ